MAQMFHISDPESDGSVDALDKPQATVPQSGNTLYIPEYKPQGKLSARHRVKSEDQTHINPESGLTDDDCFSIENAPFRVRSRSAPPALWAARKYGQQLRRMSDEFDTMLLDKGGMKRVKSAGTTRQMRTSFSWFTSLFSHKETEGDTSGSITASETRAAE
ncbi:BCL2 associated agonist of cell death b [Engraulis encrasicolus]|uniref:BCL2 associated agonist of cell death b n=1 Tax=Engraulis encrasicolus TaxID=184585 RepID=UPI002FD424D0